MFRVLRIPRRSEPFRFLTTMLLSFGMIDEIAVGLSIIGLPLLRDQFHLSYEQLGLLFTIGECIALLLEPVINLISDRISKRLLILTGTLGMGLSFLLAGIANSYLMLILALTLCDPAGKTSIGLAQAMLIDLSPQDSARTMTRWTLLSGIGDLLAPLCVSAIVALHLGWTALCVLACSIWWLLTLLLLPLRFPRLSSNESDEKKESILAGFKAALRDPLLVRWAILSLLPSLVDEVFLGFAGLYLHDVARITPWLISLLLTLQMLGALLGLFLLDRLALYKRMSARRLLTILAVLTLPGMALFLLARTPWIAGLALFWIGLCVAGWYPIAKAQAYAQRPGRSGLVRAVISLGAPFEIVLPGLVGLLAGSFGLFAGISLLTLAPVFLLLTLIGLKDNPQPVLE